MDEPVAENDRSPVRQPDRYGSNGSPIAGLSSKRLPRASRSLTAYANGLHRLLSGAGAVAGAGVVWKCQVTQLRFGRVREPLPVFGDPCLAFERHVLDHLPEAPPGMFVDKLFRSLLREALRAHRAGYVWRHEYQPFDTTP